ncbi:MAG: hypothetical protein J6K43_06940 [Lachnospiraceae bacterium]|nr:hypothetical protein [Lachnospiraceae bacterium]
MAWGYERGFIIEYDDTLKKRIDCKSCWYYDKTDKSCMKRPLYLPVDGYDSWKNCRYFELSASTSNYEQKRKQLESIEKRKKVTTVQSQTPKQQTPFNQKKCIRRTILRGGYEVKTYTCRPQDVKLAHAMLEVTLLSGKAVKLAFMCDLDKKNIYISSKAYTEEAIESLKKLVK